MFDDEEDDEQDDTFFSDDDELSNYDNYNNGNDVF